MTGQILAGIFGAILGALFTGLYSSIKFGNHLSSLDTCLKGLKIDIKDLKESLNKRCDTLEKRIEDIIKGEYDKPS